MKGLLAAASLMVMTEADWKAEDARLSLAQEIEQESETLVVQDGNHGALSERRSRSYIEVAGCDLTALIEEDGPDGQRVRGLTFDLARTVLPDSEDPNSITWGVVDLGEGGRFGEIFFEFTPPYTPTPKGFLYPDAPHKPTSWHYFTLRELVDGAQPYRLLVLLTRYQDSYCSFTR